MQSLNEVLNIALIFGAAFPLLQLPATVFNVMDAMGWGVMLAGKGRHISFVSLFRLHVASEAIMRSIPAGAPIADSVRSFLLKKEEGIPISEGVVGIVARRWSLAVTQCIYIFAGTIAGYDVISGLSRGLMHSEILPRVLLAGSAALFLAGIGLMSVLQSGDVVRRVSSVFMLIPWRRFNSWLESKSGYIARTDENLAALRSVGVRRLASSSALYAGTWLMELLETYLILRLLGFQASVQEVCAIEILVSTMRMLAFFLPAGIGVQEAGYAVLMGALGLSAPGASAAMVIVFKRVRDLLWIAGGYSILLHKGFALSRKSIITRLNEV